MFLFSQKAEVFINIVTFLIVKRHLQLCMFCCFEVDSFSSSTQCKDKKGIHFQHDLKFEIIQMQ